MYHFRSYPNLKDLYMKALSIKALYRFTWEDVLIDSEMFFTVPSSVSETEKV